MNPNFFSSRRVGEELTDATTNTRAARLELALNNIGQGLLMFDPSGRLVVSNDPYIRMYGLSREVVKPGCSLRDVIRHRCEMGFGLRNPEEFCEGIIGRFEQRLPCELDMELEDGRTIHVMERPLAEGWWVATHEDITKMRRIEAKLAHVAFHDVLTNLPNRFLFRRWLEQSLRSCTSNDGLALLYVDLDNFQGINDVLGHQVGDEILQGVADSIRRNVKMDDCVARLGGDEFVIVQRGANGTAEAAMLASRIQEAIAAPHRHAHHVQVEASVGVALAPRDGRDPDWLLRSAGAAMQAAKMSGRGSCRFFEPEMGARMSRRKALEIDLRHAIARDEVELHYQPIVDLKLGQVSCCEALLRWKHRSRGQISPAEFIPIAEETGAILALGEWVIRNACLEAARWPDHIKVAINVSPIQLKRQDLPALVFSALAASGLPALRLEIEVTEAVMMQETEATSSALQRLKEFGVTIVLDDFGTGYSSLSCLRKFSFDKIKIDKSFVQKLPDERNSAAIVQAVMSLASALGIKTTAEGVETAQQRLIAETSGFSEMQGFLFSPPRRAQDLSEILSLRAKNSSA